MATNFAKHGGRKPNRRVTQSTTQSLAKVKNIGLHCGKKTPNKLLK